MNTTVRISPAPVSPGKAAFVERRGTRRLKMSQPVRVRPADPRCEEEVRATLNFSRSGLYFTTRLQHYYLGMKIELAFPYREGEPVYRMTLGEVIRVDRRAEGMIGVAVRLLLN